MPRYCRRCNTEVFGDVCPACNSGEVYGEARPAPDVNVHLHESGKPTAPSRVGSNFAYIIFAILSFIASTVFYVRGYNKMCRYANPEHYGEKVNVYVGGDAYNYIINSSYATAFFVLAVGFMLSGLMCIAIYYLSKPKSF